MIASANCHNDIVVPVGYPLMKFKRGVITHIVNVICGIECYLTTEHWKILISSLLRDIGCKLTGHEAAKQSHS